MAVLPDLAGSWLGTNGFRLMPDDPLAEYPATASVTLAAGGHLTTFAYSWEHPVDGRQDGLLVMGAADDEGAIVALWADSWHQKPAPMSLSGRQTAGPIVEFEAEYGGGWAWRIAIDGSDADNLRMRMDNVIPADQATADIAAGPYPAMLMDVRRP